MNTREWYIIAALSRLVLLYKGLIGKASIPTDGLITLVRCSVYVKTVRLLDKICKFLKCPTIVFSLSVRLSDECLVVN